MSAPMILVTLTDDQIAKAKAANGPRKRITHALLCDPYGQIFGTEIQCRKFFEAWRPDRHFEVQPGQWIARGFPHLFDEARITQSHDIRDFETTFDLVNILVSAEELSRAPDPMLGRVR